MAKLLIFDLDGTLFNLAVDWGAVKTRLASFMAGRDDVFQTDLSADAAAYLKAAEADGVTHGNAPPYDRNALEALIQTYDAAVVSRNYRATVQVALGRLGLPALYIVSKEDVTRQKPDPEGIMNAMTHFSLQPDETVMIGDTYHDVEAARAAGIRVIIVKNARNSFTPDGADQYIESLDELAQVL